VRARSGGHQVGALPDDGDLQRAGGERLGDGQPVRERGARARAGRRGRPRARPPRGSGPRGPDRPGRSRAAAAPGDGRGAGRAGVLSPGSAGRPDAARRRRQRVSWNAPGASVTAKWFSAVSSSVTAVSSQRGSAVTWCRTSSPRPGSRSPPAPRPRCRPRRPGRRAPGGHREVQRAEQFGGVLGRPDLARSASAAMARPFHAVDHLGRPGRAVAARRGRPATRPAPGPSAPGRSAGCAAAGWRRVFEGGPRGHGEKLRRPGTIVRAEHLGQLARASTHR